MDNRNPPNFSSPIPTVSPTVRSLTESDELFIEKGVSFSKFLPIKPLDPLDLIKNSGVLCYYFKDNSVFINSKRIFLELEFEACLEDGTALTQDHNVSASNVMSHTIIDSCVLTIGKKEYTKQTKQTLDIRCFLAICPHYEYEYSIINAHITERLSPYLPGECQLNRNQGLFILSH